MARSNSGADGSWLSATAPPLALPLSFSCWYRPSGGVTWEVLLVLGASDGSRWHLLAADGAGLYGPGASVVAHSYDGTNEAFAAATGPYLPGQWVFACAVFAASTSRTAYLDDVGVTDTGFASPTGLAALNLGGYRIGGATWGPLDGRIAEATLWRGALAAGDVLALTRGARPDLVRRDLQRLYWPLYGTHSPEPNWHLGPALTVNGSMAKQEHPRVVGPARAPARVLAAVAFDPAAFPHHGPGRPGRRPPRAHPAHAGGSAQTLPGPFDLAHFPWPDCPGPDTDGCDLVGV